MDSQLYRQLLEFGGMLALSGFVFFAVRWIPNKKGNSETGEYQSPGWLLEMLSPYIIGVGVLGVVIGGVGLLAQRFM